MPWPRPAAIQPAATESLLVTQESQTLRFTAAQRDAVSITVYNQNFGLVREIRTLDLTSGRIALEYGDVASSIQPETVYIRSLSGGPLQVLEQNYQFDLLSPQKLLEKYVGRTVNVYRTNPETGVDEAIEAEVVSVNGGTILRIGGEITFNYPGRFGFPEVPDNPIAEPTLLWRLDATGGQQEIEVSYLTGGLNWKSDHVMVPNEDDGGRDHRSAGDTRRPEAPLARGVPRRARAGDAGGGLSCVIRVRRTHGRSARSRLRRMNIPSLPLLTMMIPLSKNG